MNRMQMVARVRSLTRDLSGTVFRESDILDWINEGIDRLMQVVSEFEDMDYLNVDTDEPALLPKSYHSLIPLFSTARCFAQDERNYQATTYMNEFETKLDELKNDIENGRVIIKDSLGNAIDKSMDSFYVVDNYFADKANDGENFDAPEDEDFASTSSDGSSTTDSPIIVQPSSPTVVVDEWGEHFLMIIDKDSTVPTTGTWNVGDRRLCYPPLPGGNEGWVCTTAGSFTDGAPPVFKEYGLISE